MKKSTIVLNSLSDITPATINMLLKRRTVLNKAAVRSKLAARKAATAEAKALANYELAMRQAATAETARRFWCEVKARQTAEAAHAAKQEEVYVAFFRKTSGELSADMAEQPAIVEAFQRFDWKRITRKYAVDVADMVEEWNHNTPDDIKQSFNGQILTVEFYRKSGKLDVEHINVRNGWAVILGDDHSIEHIVVEVRSADSHGNHVSVRTARYRASEAEQYAQQLLHLDAGMPAFVDLRKSYTANGSMDFDELQAISEEYIFGKQYVAQMPIDMRKYAAFGHGANAANRGMIKLAPKSICGKLYEFCHSGINRAAAMNVAKDAAYGGQLLTYTRPYPTMLDPDRILLVDSREVEKELISHTVSTDFEVKTGVTKVVRNLFDGMSVLFATDAFLDEVCEGLSEEMADKIRRRWRNLPNHSVKGLGYKGAVSVLARPWQEFFKAAGIHEINGKPIDYYVMLADASQFKFSLGEGKQYADWEAYCAAFKRDSHNYGMCITHEHGHESDFPSQQMRELVGSNSDAVRFGAQVEAARLIDETINPAKLLPAMFRFIAEQDAEFVKLPAMMNMARINYMRQRFEALAGTSHCENHYNFMFGDPLAFITMAVRQYNPLAKARFALGMHCVYCAASEYHGDCVMTRNPSISAAGIANMRMLNRIDKNPLNRLIRAYDEAYYMSILSDEVHNLGADFDGDGAKESHAKWLIDATVSRDSAWTITHDWVAGGSKKIAYSNPKARSHAIADHFRNVVINNGIGISDNLITKLAERGLITPEINACGARYQETLIDSGKGNAEIVNVDSTSEFGKVMAEVRNDKMPLWKAYARAAEVCASKPDWNYNEWIATQINSKGECRFASEHGESINAMWSATIDEIVPTELCSIDEARNSESKFDVRHLMLGKYGIMQTTGLPMHAIAGLFRQSSVAVEEGLWQHLCRARRTALIGIDETHGEERANFRRERSNAIRMELANFALYASQRDSKKLHKTINYTFNDVYDYITACIFTKRNITSYDLLAWLDVFQPEAEKAIRQNYAVELPDLGCEASFISSELDNDKLDELAAKYSSDIIDDCDEGCWLD